MGNSDPEKERSYMMRAIDLAKRAEGYTSPNPMVGCVLVKDGRIVGEGFHAKPGSAHAEAVALRASNEAAGATAYVTLEPCSHFGKTPPCADALVKAGIAKVIYAVSDPNPLAAGGAETLRNAGIETEQGLCEEEASYLIRHWLHHQRTRRPHVTAKFSASLDGKIATRDGDSKWITSPEARLRGHDLRQASDAIIVGIETIITDDPSLTARPVLRAGRGDAAHPLRVVLDSTGSIPLDAKILRSTTQGNTLVATTSAIPALKKAGLANRNIDVLVLPADENSRPDIAALLGELGKRGILSAMIEGGSTVLGSFFDARLVDEVWAFLAPFLIGGNGLSSVGGFGISTLDERHQLANVSVTPCGPDFLFTGQLISAAVEAIDAIDQSARFVESGGSS